MSYLNLRIIFIAVLGLFIPSISAQNNPWQSNNPNANGANNPAPYIAPGSQPNMNPASSNGFPQGINYPAGTSSQQGTYGWNAAQQQEASLYNNQPPSSNNPPSSSWVPSQGNNQLNGGRDYQGNNPLSQGSNNVNGFPLTQGTNNNNGNMLQGANQPYMPMTGAAGYPQEPVPLGYTPYRFCTVSDSEEQHCRTMSWTLNKEKYRSAAPESFRGKRQAGAKPVKFFYQCVRAIDKLECMKWIAGDRSIARADVVLATPGEAYVGMEYNLVPLSQENFLVPGSGRVDFVESIVAVVRAEAGIDRVEQLQGKTACFGPVGDLTWDMVTSYLRVTARQIARPNCHENDMDVMMRYFGDMCAPYEQRNFTQAENARYQKLCRFCMAQCPNPQSVARDHALNCLTQNPQAQVAFMPSSVLQEALRIGTLPNPAGYHVLCPQAQEGKVPLGPQQPNPGQWNSNTRSVQEWSECYLGRIPTNAYLTRANDPNYEPMSDRLFEISFGGGSLDPLTGGPPQRHQWLENFVLSRYEGQQRVYSLKPLKSPDLRGANAYLDGYIAYMQDENTCSNQARAKWCTISAQDQEKCQMMQQAFKAHRLRPELQCDPPVKNTYQCIDKIHRNQSDIALIDIGDLATASSHHDAIQLAQERYTTSGQNQYSQWGNQNNQNNQNNQQWGGPNNMASMGGDSSMDELFSVAVVKGADMSSLSSLRGRRACFSGLHEAHGFVLPMTALKENGLIDRRADCRYIEQAETFFGDSCLPGLGDVELNPRGLYKDKLCKQCAPGCSRNPGSVASPNSGNRYAGPLGAISGLREGKCDVAFVPHTVLMEIQGREREQYMLVCVNGRQGLDAYTSCNLGRAPGSVLITSKYKGFQEKRRLTEMILSASRLFAAEQSSSTSVMNPYQRIHGSLTPLSLERSRKTFNMFGKRNLTTTGASPYPSTGGQPTGYGPYAPTNPNQGYNNGNNQGGMTLAPGVMDYNLMNTGHHTLFGIGAYDLRGFPDINNTHPREALGQSYMYVAERTEWKGCVNQNAAGRSFSVPSLFGLFLTVAFSVRRLC